MEGRPAFRAFQQLHCTPWVFLFFLVACVLAEEAKEQPAANSVDTERPSEANILADALDGAAALDIALNDGFDPSQSDVLYALEHGWWDAATAMLRTMRERGEAVGAMQEVRSTATRIRDQATDVINLLRVGANAEETSVSCAFQWAQRPEYIYLNVKFSSRIDGPVTVLNVDNENITLTNSSLVFTAVGRQKPKTFRLNLDFHKEIDPDLSQWSFASVGRLSFTIAKKSFETWPRLLHDKKKPKNMHHWYERQVALDAEVKKEAQERRDAKDNSAKDAASKAKGSASDGADNSSQPPAPPKQPGKASKEGVPAKKSKSGKKAKSKAKKATKDEL